GYITITGRVKNLFKLSTGKFVMPQGLEQELEAASPIDYALVVGEGEKYCSAVLFLNEEEVEKRLAAAAKDGQGRPTLRGALDGGGRAEQLKEPAAQANRRPHHWSTVKRAAVTIAELTAENGHLTPTMKVRRGPVLRDYSRLLAALYRGAPLD